MRIDNRAAIALEIISRERQSRELQMELAHANRVGTMGQLSASITHEVNQPIAAARINVVAALRCKNNYVTTLPLLSAVRCQRAMAVPRVVVADRRERRQRITVSC